jgi:hypothetical protein
MFRKTRHLLIAFGAASMLSATGALCLAEQQAVTQTAGVDNSRLGAYRALAQLSFQAFQKGDREIAAELARILERTLDAAGRQPRFLTGVPSGSRSRPG